MGEKRHRLVRGVDAVVLRVRGFSEFDLGEDIPDPVAFLLAILDLIEGSIKRAPTGPTFLSHKKPVQVSHPAATLQERGVEPLTRELPPALEEPIRELQKVLREHDLSHFGSGMDGLLDSLDRVHKAFLLSPESEKAPDPKRSRPDD